MERRVRRLTAQRARRAKQREADYRVRVLQSRARDGPSRHYGLLFGMNPALDRPRLEGAELQAAMDNWVREQHMTPQQRSQLQTNTIFQAAAGVGSLWDQTRRKSVSSRHHKRIAKMRATTSRRNAIFDIRYKVIKPTKDMRHGIKYEPEAIRKFEEDYGFKATRCGLFSHEEFPWITCTPGKWKESDLLECKVPNLC